MYLYTRLSAHSFLLAILFFSMPGITPADSLTPQQLDLDSKRYLVTTEKCFDDVIEDIEFAISQHNYRLTGRNDIGKAIAKRTSSAYPDATILHFCSIQIAKNVYEINPDFLLHMPCRIAVRKAANKVIIEARLIPENDPDMHALALRINQMMRDIADYGAN